jgi:hypothetical protein
VFLGAKRDVPMSDMALSAVLKRMGFGDLTAHGFRSTFRDWAAEATAHVNHVVDSRPLPTLFPRQWRQPTFLSVTRKLTPGCIR